MGSATGGEFVQGLYDNGIAPRGIYSCGHAHEIHDALTLGVVEGAWDNHPYAQAVC